MSLKKSNNNDAPIFDKPAQKKATGFFLRRLMSLAGKPVLAEKNLPISPSTDEFAEKCYVCNNALLYRQKRISGSRLDFKPTVKNYTVPQHSDFAATERLNDESNFLSVSLTKLKTVFASRAADKPAPITINKYHQVVTGRFFASSKPAAAYAFMPSTAAPGLIGTIAKLSSIKLTAACKEIKEPAHFSGFKKNLNWQARDFSYPDSQLIFSSGFPESNSVFFSYPPEQCNFALFPGDYGFLPAAQTGLCHLDRNAGKQKFVTTALKSAATFDSRTEFARNLVILWHSSLRPLDGSVCALHAKPENPGPSLELSNRPLNQMPRQREYFKCILSDPAARLKASTEIVPPVLRDLKAAPGPQTTHVKSEKKQFAGTILLNLACQASRSRLKLRLSLKQAAYSNEKNVMQTLAHHPTFKALMPLPVRLTSSFPPFAISDPRKKLLTVCSPGISPTYATRRDSMRFVSSRHAKYCRKALKTIFASHPTRVNECRVETGTRYFVSSKLSETRRYRDFFTSSKVFNAAINVIYLRSMPFLMKLSAMHFTDIFLPEAQRRAAASPASFHSDLAPLPPRRRNTLKSLRFKLTRINNGYVAASLRARRQIPQPPDRFRISDAIKTMRITEPAKLSARTGEKSYTPGYRGRLARFASVSRLPLQITDQLTLAMPILDDAARGDLPQKHFIFPTAWETAKKPHKCRVILPPHPFGFPLFRLPTDNFNLVESAISFSFKLTIPGQLTLTSCGSVSSARQHLPPLSLKNPRRFLFAESRWLSEHHDNYLARKELLRDKFPVPAKIEAFAHEWGLKKSRKLALTIFHRMPALRARQKITADFASVSAYSLYQPIPPRQELLHFFTPHIKRLLLSFDKFSGSEQPSAVEIKDRPAIICSPRRFSTNLQLPATESFRKPANTFSFKIPSRKKIDEEFSSNSACKSSYTAFLHRPRIFMFPYQPEHSRAELAVEFKTQDEPLLDRLTFFDQTVTESCFLAGVGLLNPPGQDFDMQMFINTSSQPGSFINQVTSNPLLPFAEYSDKAETRLDYERTMCRQQIDDSSFKKITDAARLKLRKFKHIRSQISGYLSTGVLPARDSFSNRTGSHIPQRLSCDNLHWIILLRSFVDLPMPDKKLFNAKMAGGARPDISTLKSIFSCTFTSVLPDNFSDNLRPAKKIDRYALSTLADTRKFIGLNPNFTCSGNSVQQVFAPTVFSPESYNCIGADNEFTMCVSERPDYRRNIELYILHMAIDIDDYSLDSGFHVRPLAGLPSAQAVSREEYRQPHIPEWFDLPQAMVHRSMMRI